MGRKGRKWNKSTQIKLLLKLSMQDESRAAVSIQLSLGENVFGSKVNTIQYMKSVCLQYLFANFTVLTR